MADLIDLDLAKKKLNVDFDDDDDKLELYISAASDAIISYLKDQADDLLPEGEDVPPVLQMAALLLVQQFYEGEPDAFVPGYLPAPVLSLLYPLRDPALK